MTHALPTAFVLLPGQPHADGRMPTLGVMGGGQLGRMFVHAAQAMGYETAVLDPDPHSPAGRVSHHHVCTAYDDDAGLAQLAELCDAVTTEFENVPAHALAKLAERLPVAPAASCVAVAQDRLSEKAHFDACARAGGLGPAPYAAITSAQDLAQVPADLLPGILKTARMGYDGKGQARVNTAAELANAWQAAGQVPCVLEKRLTLLDEYSVIVVRGRDGQCVHFPVQRNLHRNGILAVTEVFEGLVPAEQARLTAQSAMAIAAELGYVGVLCVEFFAVQDAPNGPVRLVVNEMAPRPHNSGHYTQNGCTVSQFEMQVRAMAGLPLPMPRLHSASVMLNLLGDLWHNADGRLNGPAWDEVLALPGTHLHLYGKQDAKIGRKMGHLNVTAASAEAAKAVALQAADILGIAPW